MNGNIAPLLERFTERPSAVREELRIYAEGDPQGFRQEVMPLLRNGCDAAARRFILQLLVQHSGLIGYLADPAQSPIESAIAFAKELRDSGVPLETALDHLLASAVCDRDAGDTIVRLLALFSALSWSTRIIELRTELMAHCDERVRSKAAMEIAKSIKSAAWVASILIKEHPRVQANAVEGLWDNPDRDLKPILMIASRSPHGRVAANGLLGLYRHGALESIALLLKMAEAGDPDRRGSAIWAMGETQDPRFLPFLIAAFEKAQGKDKHRVLRALSRIRQQQKAAEQAGKVLLRVLGASVREDGSRWLNVSVWSQSASLGSMPATRFALWENERLITDYSVQIVPTPPVLIVGCVTPRFTSKVDAYGQAVERALLACADLKRSMDPWCMQRYLESVQTSTPDSQVSMSSGDPALALHLKIHRGFVLAPDLFRKMAAEPGPRTRATTDVTLAIAKVVHVLGSASGRRHVLAFFESSPVDEVLLRRLANSLKTESLSLHGFAPQSGSGHDLIRELCETTPGGSFAAVPHDRLGDAVMQAYLALLDRYEITYPAPDPAAPAPPRCELRLSAPQGAVSLAIDFPSATSPNSTVIPPGPPPPASLPEPITHGAN